MNPNILKLFNENLTGLSELGYGFFTGIGFSLGVLALFWIFKILFLGQKRNEWAGRENCFCE